LFVPLSQHQSKPIAKKKWALFQKMWQQQHKTVLCVYIVFICFHNNSHIEEKFLHFLIYINKNKCVCVYCRRKNEHKKIYRIPFHIFSTPWRNLLRNERAKQSQINNFIRNFFRLLLLSTQHVCLRFPWTIFHYLTRCINGAESVNIFFLFTCFQVCVLYLGKPFHLDFDRIDNRN
jgi:hypothetical protein